ncbi:MAG: hypothetical protein AAF570_09405 [Bacteroidota bacterium]
MAKPLTPLDELLAVHKARALQNLRELAAMAISAGVEMADGITVNGTRGWDEGIRRTGRLE